MKLVQVQDKAQIGLTQSDDFWGALRPKNHQIILVFHSKCVSPTRKSLILSVADSRYERRGVGSKFRCDLYRFSAIPDFV
jgi:hypothetical protein